jgi:hypothetical protein
MMKRLDYEVLSAVFAESEVDDHARRALAFETAEALCGTGERFDPVLWLRQCKVGAIDPQDVASWSALLGNRVDSLARRRAHYEQRVASGAEH